MSSLRTRNAEVRAIAAAVPWLWTWQEGPARPADYLVPTLGGCLMLVASVLPWLKDPLDGRFSAWQLSVDIGWQVHVSLISYGLLCVCGALPALSYAFMRRRGARAPLSARRAHLLLSLCCAAPILLFLLQYLFVDLHSINIFAQHRREFILISRHLGYNSPRSLIPLQPFTLGISTLLGRVQLVIDQMSYGMLLAAAGAALIIGYHRPFARPAEEGTLGEWTRAKSTWLLVLLLACAIVLGRAPAAMICNYEAKASLAVGDYSGALLWLDSALALNPALEQLSFYHEERGQALYYLYPGEQSDNSHAYLAQVYRLQRDYVDAYKELLAGWSARAAPAWMVDEMSTTLELQAEYEQAQGTVAAQLAKGNTPARPWIEELLQIDGSNVFAQYAEGRIQCSVKNYAACAAYMANVLYLSKNPMLLSSAYTYMGLSAQGEGNYAQARQLLLKAVKLDPNYRNNTAREELSGLH